MAGIAAGQPNLPDQLAGAARDAAMGYVVSAPLMVFGEAFLTGGALALMVVYRPQWVASFEDARWLKPGD